MFLSPSAQRETGSTVGQQTTPAPQSNFPITSAPNSQAVTYSPQGVGGGNGTGPGQSCSVDATIGLSFTVTGTWNGPGFFLLNISSARAYGIPAENSPMLTQAQVNQVVTNFLRQIGQPVRNTASISLMLLPSRSGYGTLAVSQNRTTDMPAQAHWQVTVPDAVYPKHLEVSGVTGQIVHYIREDNSKDHQPLGTPLPKAQAIARATSALTSAGAFKTNELVLKEAILMQGSADSQEWFVSWTRMFGRAPYREQDANVSVDAQTGEVTGFSVNFHTAPPASMTFSVSRDQATATATQAFAAAGLRFVDAPIVKAEVVQPNGYWQPDGSEADRRPFARAAWTCRFRNGRQAYEAWVDAETGRLIGGQYSGPRGRVRLNSPNPPAKR